MGVYPGLLVESNTFSSEATISDFVYPLCLVCGFYFVLFDSDSISPEKTDIRVTHTIFERRRGRVGAIRCKRPVVGQPRGAAPTFYDHIMGEFRMIWRKTRGGLGIFSESALCKSSVVEKRLQVAFGPRRDGAAKIAIGIGSAAA